MINSDTYKLDMDDLECEYTPSVPQRDAIFVRDGRGILIEMEVIDDAGNN